MLTRGAWVALATEGILSKKERESARQELMDHIADHTEALCAAGLSPEEAEDRAVAAMGDPNEVGALLRKIHHDIPQGSGFSPEMIHQIMSNAVVAPKFNAYSQAMIMVESAIQEASTSQLGQSGMLIAESEINFFLNKS